MISNTFQFLTPAAISLFQQFYSKPSMLQFTITKIVHTTVYFQHLVMSSLY